MERHLVRRGARGLAAGRRLRVRSREHQSCAFRRPMTPAEAAGHVRSWTAQPVVSRLDVDASHVEAVLKSLEGLGTAGNLPMRRSSPSPSSTTPSSTQPTRTSCDSQACAGSIRSPASAAVACGSSGEPESSRSRRWSQRGEWDRLQWLSSRVFCRRFIAPGIEAPPCACEDLTHESSDFVSACEPRSIIG